MPKLGYAKTIVHVVLHTIGSVLEKLNTWKFGDRICPYVWSNLPALWSKFIFGCLRAFPLIIAYVNVKSGVKLRSSRALSWCNLFLENWPIGNDFTICSQHTCNYWSKCQDFPLITILLFLLTYIMHIMLCWDYMFIKPFHYITIVSL